MWHQVAVLPQPVPDIPDVDEVAAAPNDRDGVDPLSSSAHSMRATIGTGRRKVCSATRAPVEFTMTRSRPPTAATDVPTDHPSSVEQVFGCV